MITKYRFASITTEIDAGGTRLCPTIYLYSLSHIADADFRTEAGRVDAGSTRWVPTIYLNSLSHG
jgi:hypothetical protein